MWYAIESCVQAALWCKLETTGRNGGTKDLATECQLSEERGEGVHFSVPLTIPIEVRQWEPTNNKEKKKRPIVLCVQKWKKKLYTWFVWGRMCRIVLKDDRHVERKWWHSARRRKATRLYFLLEVIESVNGWNSECLASGSRAAVRLDVTSNYRQTWLR